MHFTDILNIVMALLGAVKLLLEIWKLIKDIKGKKKNAKRRK